MSWLKNLLYKAAHFFWRCIGVKQIVSGINEITRPIGASCQIAQINLRLQYQALQRQGGPFPKLSEVEFRCYSQNGEDGILLYIFSLIGTTNRKVIEFCAGDGVECNAANLIINHEWQGLLVDGNSELIKRGKAFYARCGTTYISPPVLVQDWVTPETVNGLVQKHGFAGEVDMLSIDMDGFDYWVWRALDCVKPRVVILEFNPAFGYEKSLTLPNKADFQLDISKKPYQYGASLAAMTKLGKEKGYRLVGSQVFGYNAFFVRNGLGESVLPTISPKECFAQNPPRGGMGPGIYEVTPDRVESFIRSRPDWQEV